MEKTVERVIQMLSDLSMAGIPMTKVAKGSGVTGVTLWQIKKGGQKSVSERVFDGIWDFWSENAPAMTEPTNGKLKAVEKPQDAPEAVKAPKPVKVKAAKQKPQEQAVKKATKTAAEPTEIPPTSINGMINRDLVPVNVQALTALLDGMIDRFQTQVDELEAVEKLLGSNNRH